MAAGDSVDYTSATQFTPFVSKAEFMQHLSDPDNEFQRNRLEFIARLANTDTSAWADPTAGLANNITGRL